MSQDTTKLLPTRGVTSIDLFLYSPTYTSVLPKTLGLSCGPPASKVTTAYGSEVPFPSPATFFSLDA